ncbi:hypothetical protein D3C76_894110 [compost metagenome]
MLGEPLLSLQIAEVSCHCLAAAYSFTLLDTIYVRLLIQQIPGVVGTFAILGEQRQVRTNQLTATVGQCCHLD